MELKPSFCPFCGAPVEESVSGFIELGVYLGDRYEVEGSVYGYACTSPEQHGFYVWPDGSAISKQKLSELREGYDEPTLEVLRIEGCLD